MHPPTHRPVDPFIQSTRISRIRLPFHAPSHAPSSPSSMRLSLLLCMPLMELHHCNTQKHANANGGAVRATITSDMVTVKPPSSDGRARWSKAAVACARYPCLLQPLLFCMWRHGAERATAWHSTEDGRRRKRTEIWQDHGRCCGCGCKAQQQCVGRRGAPVRQHCAAAHDGRR